MLKIKDLILSYFFKDLNLKSSIIEEEQEKELIKTSKIKLKILIKFIFILKIYKMKNQ